MATKAGDSSPVAKLLDKIKGIVAKCNGSAHRSLAMPSKRVFEGRSTVPLRKPKKSGKESRARRKLKPTHQSDIRSTIDALVLEESMLTVNSDLKEYWAKIIECARRKNQLAEEVSIIQRRRKVLESMNSTNYHPTSKFERL